MQKAVNWLIGFLVVLVLAPLSFAQDKSKPSEPATAKLQLTRCAFTVSGMTCDGCAGNVQKALLKLEGVKAAKVDFRTSGADVEYDAKKISPEKIVAAFNHSNPGYRVELVRRKEK